MGEPLNAVLYKDIGNEYRSHCDGRCWAMSDYRIGERVATTILYCRTADEGGQTTFSDGTLKIAPRDGDLLLFSYLSERHRLSHTAQVHSGCPIRKGAKWIATQWYREGVSEEWNYVQASREVDEVDDD